MNTQSMRERYIQSIATCSFSRPRDLTTAVILTTRMENKSHVNIQKISKAYLLLFEQLGSSFLYSSFSIRPHIDPNADFQLPELPLLGASRFTSPKKSRIEVYQWKYAILPSGVTRQLTGQLAQVKCAPCGGHTGPRLVTKNRQPRQRM